MKRLFYLSSLLMLLLAPSLRADEGMWLPGNLNRSTRRALRELGLELPARHIYDPQHPSLTDAVVSFGGFCSGVVVSAEGLVFTNHHCGFHSVQQLSTMQNDYVSNGFTAFTRKEELPCPELYVRFLLRQEDVTRRVLSALRPGMDEEERAWAVDSVGQVICGEVLRQDSTLVALVDPCYDGNEFCLSVYRDYNDVRLVYAPPSSIGKFGWDKDNWEWPRHTGDFCLFRIYADEENRPAAYSPLNRPYHPAYVAPISLQGYREGDFCMTLGYPGQTRRYLSSFGIEERMEAQNRAQIEVRGLKQAIWKQEMDCRDSIRLKYAAKYDESSNYWKNSIGMNRSLRRLHVPDKKRALEQELRRWIRQHAPQDTSLVHLLPDLELAYRQRRELSRAKACFDETFLNGPELVQQALSILNFDYEAGREEVVRQFRTIMKRYEDMDVEIDKKVFTALLRNYRMQVDTAFLPAPYYEIDARYGGNEQAWVDTLYARTRLATPRGLQSFFLEQDSTYQLLEDPAVSLGIDLILKAFEMQMAAQPATQQIERGERLLNAAVRRMQAGHNFYPDANFTMRLSLGTVRGYAPADGAWYSHYTTPRGILEKVRAYEGDPDFRVQPRLLELLSSPDKFGRYADSDGEMHICFLSDNDITGGNSGSAMFNARGELLGLAFDGNWEAMSSDFLYEPQKQRCIGVDIRYALFIMEHYGQAAHLVQEMEIVPTP